MRFRDVQHQDRALGILRRALRSGRTHHAYLFEGPEGVGKERAARALAARLLCSADAPPDADACGACAPCQLVAADNHPDLHVIHRGLHRYHPDATIRKSKGLFLVVDVVRQFLIERAASAPNLGRARVFIIRDAERMNDEAQNALLKTLEEPPGHSRLLLVSAAPLRLLPTIRSRCQRIQFDLLPTSFIEERLADRSNRGAGVTPADDVRALARLSGGSLGLALRWRDAGLLDTLATVADPLSRIGQMSPDAFAKQLIELAEALAERTRGAPNDDPRSARREGPRGAGRDDARAVDSDTSAESEEVEADETAGKSKSDALSTDELRAALKLVLMLVATVYRDALVVAHTRSAAPRAVAQALSQRAATDRLDEAIRGVAHAEAMLDRNVAPALACERLALALAGDA